MLRDRSLLALTTAELVSTLALPWFVFATTHSSTRMGPIMLAEDPSVAEAA